MAPRGVGSKAAQPAPILCLPLVAHSLCSSRRCPHLLHYPRTGLWLIHQRLCTLRAPRAIWCLLNCLLGNWLIRIRWHRLRNQCPKLWFLLLEPYYLRLVTCYVLIAGRSHPCAFLALRGSPSHVLPLAIGCSTRSPTLLPRSIMITPVPPVLPLLVVRVATPCATIPRLSYGIL